MKFAITCSLYNRPAYTKVILEKLAQCELAEEIPTYIRIDPSKYSDTILELANAYPHKKTIIANKFRMGCSLNIFSAIKDGFDSGADFVIHVEDDIYLAKDALRYFTGQAQTHKDDQTIFSINGYNRDPEAKSAADLYSFFSANDWNCWGWGVWKDRWDRIKTKWAFGEHSGGQSWDVKIKPLILKQGLKGVFPCISVVKNIGAENGTYTPSIEFHKLKHTITNFSDDFVIN